MTLRILGDRIYLRKLTVEDVGPRYLAWLCDPEVNQFLETRHSEQSLESISEFVRSKNRTQDELLFSICLIEDDRHIGNIKLGPINTVHRNACISLFIGEKDCWGKGYATEAIGAVVNYAMIQLKLEKLHAGAYLQNIGSIRAFERNGFHREGLLKRHVLSKGQRTDVVLLGLCSPDSTAR